MERQKSYRIGLDSFLMEGIGKIVGSENITAGEQSLAKALENTLDSRRIVTAHVRPGSQEEVLELMKYFEKENLPYYPVSTGRNWGYGGKLPVEDGCVILELSRLRRIVEFNAELGYVVVEPGVTQQQLYDFLEKRAPGRFMVPDGRGTARQHPGECVGTRIWDHAR
jgi:4-cresol dehydrogenase (hydroxylating)